MGEWLYKGTAQEEYVPDVGESKPTPVPPTTSKYAPKTEEEAREFLELAKSRGMITSYHVGGGVVSYTGAPRVVAKTYEASYINPLTGKKETVTGESEAKVRMEAERRARQATEAFLEKAKSRGMITGYSIEGGKVSYTPHAREPRPGEPRLVKIEGVSVPIAVPAPLPEEEYPPGRTKAEMYGLKAIKKYEETEAKVSEMLGWPSMAELKEMGKPPEFKEVHKGPAEVEKLKEWYGVHIQPYEERIRETITPATEVAMRYPIGEYKETREHPVKTVALFGVGLVTGGIAGSGILPHVPVVSPIIKYGPSAAWLASVGYRGKKAYELGGAGGLSEEMGRITAGEIIPIGAGSMIGGGIAGMIKRWRTPTTYEVTRIKGVGAKEFELSQRLGEEWQYGRIKALGFETEKYTVTGEPPKITDLSQYTDIHLKPTGKEVNLRIFTIPEKFGGATTLQDLFGGEFIISPEYPPTGVIGFEPIGKEPSAIPFEHFFGRATYTQYRIYGIPKTAGRKNYRF